MSSPPSPSMVDSPVPVILEVARSANQCSLASAASVKEAILQSATDGTWTHFSPSKPYMTLTPELSMKCQYVRCEVLGTEFESLQDIPYQDAAITVYVYTLNTDEEEVEELAVGEDDDGDEEHVTAGTTSTMPHARHDKLWENLFYDDDTKSGVVEGAAASLLFARSGISPDIVSTNRLILLYGPPGTGKTTFCKSIAQKLCIRLSDTYPRGKLIEINSHSLFSKWFSESGKLVSKLFSQILDDARDDPNLLLCVLIDEVESLASSRQHGGSDPQDAVRAGNAVLTQLDRLRQYPNVIILCTSNLTNMIDSAFLDRVDSKIYVGPPNVEARYEILRSQVEAMIQANLLQNDVEVQLPLPTYRIFIAATKGTINLTDPANVKVAQEMAAIAQQTEAYLTNLRGRRGQLNVTQFMQLLPQTIEKQRQDAKQVAAAANVDMTD